MRRAMEKFRRGLLLFFFICGGSEAATTNSGSLASLEPTLFRLQIKIKDEDIAALRKDPRRSVTAELQEGLNRFQNVAVHLKGSVGSFRSVDDKAGLTLSFSKL